MKVLQIVKTNVGATWAFDQACALKNLGVELICMLPNEFGGMADKYKDAGMSVIGFNPALSLCAPWAFMRKQEAFRNLVLEMQPDIVHMHFFTNAIFARLALRGIGIPRIFQVPGPLHLEKRLYRAIDMATASKEFDYWIPSCEFSKRKYLQEGVEPGHLRLIYYGGYGGRSVQEYHESSNTLHEEYRLADNVKLVGMVSYFYKPSLLKGQKRGIKGHEDFFDAMSIVLSRRENVKAVVIGGPWNGCLDYEKYLKRYASRKLGANVIFTGYRNDIKSIYRELDVAVHPSHSENLGGAAESLAAGVPTIATNVGGFPDIVKNGETGLLVPKGSPKNLAEAIEAILDDPDNAYRMADAGRALVEQLLDSERTAVKVLNYYRHIAGEDE